MPTLQKPKQFSFPMNNGARFVGTGKDACQVLMKHLDVKTKEVGHKLTFDEARDPSKITMVLPNAFVGPFSSFEEAAETAWRRVRPSDGTGLTEQGKKLKEALRRQKREQR